MYKLLRPLLFRLYPENAHNLVFRLGQFTPKELLTLLYNFKLDNLKQEIFGLTFKNPVGLAAGLDKNATHIRLWKALGFGFAEVGSISALASKGNVKPRVFRLIKDEAIINRMGLNNEGANAIAGRLKKNHYSAGFDSRFVLGINIAKTHSPEIMGDDAINDFVDSFRSLAPFADYVTLNVSCPNTREGKTFEDPESLLSLLSAIFDARREANLVVPVLVKLSPPAGLKQQDLDIYKPLLEIIQQFPVAGLIASNTASDRANLSATEKKIKACGNGGLSGKPVADRSTALIRYLYQQTAGGIPIIGVGGIDSIEEAWRKITAGASLIQVYTGMIYQGPGLIKRINKGLIAKLKKHNFNHISDAVGSAT